jgi:hypothetical protein
MKNTSLIVLTICSLFLTFKVEGQALKVKEYGIGFSNLNSFSLQYRWGNENRIYRLSGTIGGATAFGKNSSNSSNILDTNSINSINAMHTKTPLSLNCGLSFSILKLKSINEKFGILYGGILGLSYSHLKTHSNITGTNSSSYNNSTLYSTSGESEYKSQTFQPNIGLALGVFYKINSSFILYAEVDPNIYYAYNYTASKSTTYGYQVNQSNSLNQTVLVSRTDHNNSFGISNLSNSGAGLTIVYRITK